LYINELRENNKALSVMHIMEYIKQHHQDWLVSYTNRHPTTVFNSLRHLCTDFLNRHSFSWRRASASSKHTPQELELKKNEFCEKFWYDHWLRDDENIINIDETGVFYDTPPRYLWAKKGQPSNLDFSEKNSSRMTAVLAARRNGIML
jgi:hypothetical protein